MARAINFIRRKWAWATSKPLVWFFFAVLFGTVAVVWVWPGPTVDRIPSDTRLRLWAMLLQAGGGVTVLFDLTSRARGHGHSGVTGSFSAWLREGLFGRNVVVHIASGNLTTKGGSVRMTVRAGVNPSATLEDRVSALEANTAHLDCELGQTQVDLDRRESEWKSLLAAESEMRTTADSEILERLRTDAVGNFGLLAFGAFWVLVGTVLSAMSPEIAKIVAGQWTTVLQGL